MHSWGQAFQDLKALFIPPDQQILLNTSPLITTNLV
jgi:hypothetical protein